MEVKVVLLANRSKSWQKVVRKSKNRQKSKNFKSMKSCKGHQFGGTFTKASVLRQWRTRASVKALTVFRTPFAELKSSLNTTFGSIINQAVLASQRLWYFFFEPLRTKFLSAECTSLLRYFSSGIHLGHFRIKTTWELVTHILSPLNFEDVLQKKTS